MKLTTTFHLTVGLLLSGCTFNHQTTVSSSMEIYSHRSEQPGKEKDLIPLIAAQHIERKDKPEAPQRCPAFKPAAIGAPVEIDLQRVTEAKSEEEIRDILQENIAALNHQIKRFQTEQDKSYRAWLKRCQ